MSSNKQWAAGLSLSILGSAVWAQADTSAATQAVNEALPEIVVKAPKKETQPDSKQHYQAVTTTAGKGKQALKDIPQSVTVVTEKLMDDKNADTLKAAMHTVSGIAFEAGEGGAIGDLIRLRGFTTRGDIFQDGMRDIAQYNRDTFNQDRIEVLRGSASMLYGRGSTGGIINQASKQPYLSTQHEVEATVGTDNYVRLTGDFNIKTGDDAALRINVMKTDADSFRNGPETHRQGVAPTFSWGIGTANEFSLGYYHLSYDDVPDYGFRWLNGRPVDAAVDRWYGAQSDYQRDQADYLVASHTHRFENGGELKTAIRDGYYKRDLWATTAGLTGVSSVNAITDSSTISRGNQTRGAKDHHTFYQTDYSGKSQWFGLQNDLLAGAEVAIERTTTHNYLNTSIPAKTAITWGQTGGTVALSDTRIVNPANTFHSTTTGVYGQDTLHLTDRWKLLAGVRHDVFDGEYERASGGPLSRTDRMWSHREGIMYQPDEHANYYLSHGTSFNASGDLYQFDSRTANTPPEQSRNYELGAKWELLDGDLSMRTALFRTIKYNERNADAASASTTNYLLNAQRHTDGIEFEAAGRINSKLEVFGSLALQKGIIDKAGDPSINGSQNNEGKTSGLTPRLSGSIWATYQISSQWRAGLGADGMTGRVPAAAETSANRAPGYIKADALIEYEAQDYKVKLNLNNLFNKVYVDGVYRGFTVWGPTRGAQLSLAKTF